MRPYIIHRKKQQWYERNHEIQKMRAGARENQVLCSNIKSSCTSGSLCITCLAMKFNKSEA